MQTNIDCLDDAISLLEAKFDNWTELVNSVEDDDVRADEDQTYEDMVQNDQGLVAVLERGQAARARRRSTLRRYPRLWKQQSPQQSAPAANNVPLRVHLPKLRLPEFEGDMKLWPGFISSFKAAVDRQPILSWFM